MRNAIARSLLASALLTTTVLLSPTLLAQRGRRFARRRGFATNNALEKELDSVAIIDRKVMIPMSDGKLMAGRHLSPERRIEKVSGRFSCERLTTSTIGTLIWRAPQHERGIECGEAWLCLR